MNKIKRSHTIKPPRISGWLLKRFLSPYDRVTAVGDLEEEYRLMAEETGHSQAKNWYRKQVIKSIPEFYKNLLYWSITMFRNYLKIALRNLTKQKGYSFLNISGLAIGMACCILILLFVQDELQYDAFHEDANSIYRLVTEFEASGVTKYTPAGPFTTGPVFSREVPEVVSYTRLYTLSSLTGRSILVTYGDKHFEENGMRTVDGSFFDVFTHQFISGDPENALTQPNSIVLTEETAQRIFKEENPMGKMLAIPSLGTGTVTVTGVIKNVPQNSHLKFNHLVSWTTQNVETRTNFDRVWGRWPGTTYVKLVEGADPEEVESKFKEVLAQQIGTTYSDGGMRLQFNLQKLTDIHLRPHIELHNSGTSNISYVYIFSLVAFFILFMACINFMNLSTARSMRRSKEVGLRKVFGAYKKQLVKQFMSESFVMAFAGFFIALFIVVFSLPYFNAISGKELTISYLLDNTILSGMLGIIIFTGTFAGSYPAFFLSAFRPIVALRGKLSGNTRGAIIRKSLVVVQFSLSVILISSTLVVFEQLQFMKNTNPGFDKEQLLVVQSSEGRVSNQNKTVKNELAKNPNIILSSFSLGLPGRNTDSSIFQKEGGGGKPTESLDAMYVDHDFVKTYGLTIAYGRDFSRELDTEGARAFIINETAANQLGWGVDAVGKGFNWSDGSPENGTVVGIVKDFHNKSLKQKIRPLVFVYAPWGSSTLSIKLKTENVSETIAFIREEWSKIEPGREFNYFFLDEDFDKQYRSEEKLSQLFSFFAMLAIIIACLGLFGLASYTAEQRTKEIGIRKVLGAPVKTIIFGLSGDFAKWVLLANIIALPTAYFLMAGWIESFAYRIDIPILIFLIAGGISLSVALLTVSYQSIKAALINPIKSLRYE